MYSSVTLSWLEEILNQACGLLQRATENLKEIHLNVKVKNLKKIHVNVKVENLMEIHLNDEAENL